MSPQDLVIPEERGPLQEVAAEVISGRCPRQRLVVSAARVDGSLLPVEFSYTSVESAAGALVVGFLVDLSERRHAESALRSVDDRFRGVIEAAPEAVWIAGQRGLVYANRAALDLFGVGDFESVRGVDPRRFVDPADLTLFEERSRALLRPRGRVPPFELRAQRADGAEIELEVSSIAIDYEGEVAILSFGRDVKERRALESKVQQSERLAALGLLAGGMANRIDDPLSRVLLELDLLRGDLSRLRDADSARRARSRVREAIAATERVAAAVRSARLVARTGDGAPAPVDVAGVLGDVLALVGEELRSRSRFRATVDEAPLLLARAGQVERLLLDLLAYGARSVPSDGSGALALRVARLAEDVVIELEVDIPAGRDRRPGGSAVDAELGLLVCRGLARELGGDLELDRLTESRWLVVVRLPAVLDPDARDPIASTSSAPPSSVRHARLFVIDDDPSVLEAVRLVLERDHAVETFTSAADALPRLLRGEADIVLCDLVMPGLSGMELHAVLRERAPEVRRRMVFMTGLAFGGPTAEFLASVDNLRIEKPFDLESLRRLVQRALRSPGAAGPDQSVPSSPAPASQASRAAGPAKES